MGHYNQMIFSETKLKAKDIWNAATPVLEKLNIN